MSFTFKKAVIIFFVTFILYNANTYIDYSKDLKNGLYRRMMPSADVIPNSFLPFLVYKYHSLDYTYIFSTVELFDSPGVKANPYYLVPVGDKLVNAYPIITGLLAFPIYLPVLVLNKIPEVSYHENILKILLIGRIAAAFYTAVAVSIFYIIVSKISNDELKKIFFNLL